MVTNCVKSLVINLKTPQAGFKGIRTRRINYIHHQYNHEGKGKLQ